jgi:hypothetical protein
MAEVALGAFLKRFKADAREPDRWESWHLTLALMAFQRHDNRRVLQLVDTASLSSSQRLWSARVKGPPGIESGARLVLLQAVFEGLRLEHARRTLH